MPLARREQDMHDRILSLLLPDANFADYTVKGMSIEHATQRRRLVGWGRSVRPSCYVCNRRR